MKDPSDCLFLLRPVWTTMSHPKGHKKTTYKGMVWSSLDDLHRWADVYYPDGTYEVLTITGEPVLLKNKGREEEHSKDH